MIVRKSFQFRLKPTKKQARALENQLNECRWLYNELLAQRKLAHEELDISLTKYQQLMFLPGLKLERLALEQVHSQVLQNVVDRLDKTFQGFFRRCKKGEKAGFPRFRGIDTIAFVIPKVDSQSSLKKLDYQRSETSALRCIVLSKEKSKHVLCVKMLPVNGIFLFLVK